ncbi:MAG: UDP-N-acetylmuramoyl-L-alanine--D-glutamate ligase [Thermodesulfobacteriota bacterium]
MELGDRKMLVVGVGKTGIETVKFLLKRGARVSVSDSSPVEKIAEQAGMLESWGVKLETGGHTRETFLAADTIVLSPGVPFGIAPVREAIENGVEVISEVELASRFINKDKPVIAVTGSNGKTTTSTLIARILEKNGRKVFLGANIGTPLIQIAGDCDCYDILVLELSSFQLQGIETFRPDVSVILNVTPNHLDHHSSFDEYAESKMKIFSNQTERDWCIYKADDEVIGKYVPRIRPKKIPFGSGPDGISYDGRGIKYGNDYYGLKGVKLPGYHNVENIMAAIAAATVTGCDPRLIHEAVIEFDPLPHRIEYIGEIKGARFYNDSKSTSPGAALRALESLPPPIILIAGGKDKGVSFEPLKGTIEAKVKLMVLMGESRFRMERDLRGKVGTLLARSLEEAVEKTLENLAPGDTVLFSPACSSFDMFQSYEERGRRYKELVRNIQLIQSKGL